MKILSGRICVNRMRYLKISCPGIFLCAFFFVASGGAGAFPPHGKSAWQLTEGSGVPVRTEGDESKLWELLRDADLILAGTVTEVDAVPSLGILGISVVRMVFSDVEILKGAPVKERTFICEIPVERLTVGRGDRVIAVLRRLSGTNRGHAVTAIAPADPENLGFARAAAQDGTANSRNPASRETGQTGASREPPGSVDGPE